MDLNERELQKRVKYEKDVHYIFIIVMIKQDWEAEDHLRGESSQSSPLDLIKSEQEQIKYVRPFEELHSANPILPPGIHKQRPQVMRIKHKLVHDRDKLNKTTFPEVRNKNWLNKTHLGGIGKLGIGNIQQQDEEDMKYTEHFLFLNNENEFRQVLQGNKLLYMRVNNSKYNRVGPNLVPYFASFFLNARKDSIISKKTPIFEYLPKICKDIAPLTALDSNVLSFDSRFESANLFCAFHAPNQSIATYELYMQNDTNTKGCTQWFFFSLSAQKRVKIRIRIMNFYKPTSLYMKGMKVLVSSSEGQPNSKSEWKRVGTAIQYKKVSLGEGRESYSMEFMYEVETPHQRYYFSYGFPYSYSQLDQYLNRLTNQMPLYHRIALRTSLCKSYLGNNITLLTITDNIKVKNPQLQNRPIIYIIGRQHPGETPGSYIMEGVLKTLLSNRFEMERLRENFIIKVVPMVNVDGVICGNYRSNFSGNDVNRQWAFPSKKLHPELFNLKQQILANRKNAYFFLDIHAHSRKMNSFFYGSRPCNHEARLYSFICSKLNKHISFSESSFVDDPSKKSTARVVLETEASIKKSLTFQASFYGYEDEAKKTRVHFKMEDFRAIGESLALALFYSEVGMVQQSSGQGQSSESGSKVGSSCRLGNEKSKKKTEIELKIQKNIMKMKEKWKKQVERQNREEDNISEGSSLDPQHFQLKVEEEERLDTLLEHINNTKRSQIQPNSDHSDSEDVLVVEKKNKNLKKMDFKSNKLIAGENNVELDKTIEEGQQSPKMTFFPFQSNLRNTQMVKKLQSELQVQKSSRRYGSFNRDSQRRLRGSSNLSEFKDQFIKGQRFKSIQVESAEPTPNYRNNIIEMKQALKYFIENKTYNYKSADYDDYKNFLRYSTNGPSIMLSDKESVARIKKKYSRV